MIEPRTGTRGRRTVPHTADVRVEAWGPTREICLAEAVAGLVASFVDTTDAPVVRTATVDLTAGGEADALVEALDDVIYLLDTQGVVPVDTDIAPGPAGPRMRLHLTPVADVAATGAAPKAVTLHDLRFDRVGRGWFCAVTIDV